MFSTAWVSAVTLFSVCLSLGFVCAQSFFFSQKSGWCHRVRLGAAGMRALQWGTAVRFDECSHVGLVDDRQKANSSFSLLFHPAHALFCQFNDQSEWGLDLEALTVWLSTLFRLRPVSQAKLRHSLAVVMQDQEKEAQTTVEIILSSSAPGTQLSAKTHLWPVCRFVPAGSCRSGSQMKTGWI